MRESESESEGERERERERERYIHTTIHVSSYYFICPHTTTNVPSYYYVCVLNILYVCPFLAARFCFGRSTVVKRALNKAL